MENRGLLFVPDISGFTKFVSQVEIEHSRMIIQELLEVIINSNEIGLQISEIEGDAVLFYKFGDPPTLEELYKQVEKMFIKFHQSLIVYDHRKYCQCKACVSAIDLSLKVITHYGEYTNYNVRNFEKLIGKDVIVVHQLLKNDIPDHEYWLVTRDLAQSDISHGIVKGVEWNTSVKQFEGGEIPFRYVHLGQLKNELTPDPISSDVLLNKVKAISVSKEYNTDIITLFHASGDFNNRARWKEGIKDVKEVGHMLPRVGMKCRCILESGEEITYSSAYSYSEDKIEFCESEEKSGHCTYYRLEKKGDRRTVLTIDYYIEAGVFPGVLFNILKKQEVKKNLENSLDNLVGLVETLELEEKNKR
jgi:hypothetical protein